MAKLTDPQDVSGSNKQSQGEYEARHERIIKVSRHLSSVLREISKTQTLFEFVFKVAAIFVVLSVR